MRQLVFLPALPVALAACSAAPPPLEGPFAFATLTASEGDLPEGRVRRFAGPGYVCGLSFALDLAAGESMVENDRGLDFITYDVTDAGGGFLLYEGSAPQQAERTVETGAGFPSVIAIHLAPERAAADALAIEQRLVLGNNRETICRARFGVPAGENL